MVIVDNLSVHKRRQARLWVEAAGAQVLFLPPYSPDLNPIEQVFAKLKALLRPILAERIPSRDEWEAGVRALFDDATHREEWYAALALLRRLEGLRQEFVAPNASGILEIRATDLRFDPGEAALPRDARDEVPARHADGVVRLLRAHRLAVAVGETDIPASILTGFDLLVALVVAVERRKYEGIAPAAIDRALDRGDVDFDLAA